MLIIQAAVALPFLLWIIFRLGLPSGAYGMDPCGKGTFFPHLILYSVFGYIQVLLGIFGATWAYDFSPNLWPAAMFLLAAINALLFCGVLAFFYESFMTDSYPGGLSVNLKISNYTVGKCSLVLALGFSSIVLLIGGAAWTAMGIAR
jgi:hypothetical protein